MLIQELCDILNKYLHPQLQREDTVTIGDFMGTLTSCSIPTVVYHQYCGTILLRQTSTCKPTDKNAR